MPDDSVFTTNGLEDYRGPQRQQHPQGAVLRPQGQRLPRGRLPKVGRNYHSEALLLPDGRVATFGSDPLFDDQQNTKLGHFEQRMEIFTRPSCTRTARTARCWVTARTFSTASGARPSPPRTRKRVVKPG